MAEQPRALAALSGAVVGPICQHPHGDLHLSLTPVPGISNAHIWPLWLPGMNVVQRHTSKQNNRTHKKFKKTKQKDHQNIRILCFKPFTIIVNTFLKAESQKHAPGSEPGKQVGGEPQSWEVNFPRSLCSRACHIFLGIRKQWRPNISNLQRPHSAFRKLSTRPQA